jgi:hypothetical protein
MAERGTDRFPIESVSVAHAVGSGAYRGLSLAWQNVIGSHPPLARSRSRGCVTTSAAGPLTGFDCLDGVDNSQNQGAFACGVSQDGFWL